MTDSELAASWAMRGDLARSASFSTGKDANGTQRYVMAEVGKLGSGETITARVFELLPLNADAAAIEAALDKLYDGLLATVAGAKHVGGAF